MTATRLTFKGRVKPAPRITPTYGTAKQRRERKRREAESRNAAYQQRNRDITKEREALVDLLGEEELT